MKMKKNHIPVDRTVYGTTLFIVRTKMGNNYKIHYFSISVLNVFPDDVSCTTMLYGFM